ncbi:MAG: M14 family metallopeptidase [Alphaproteobacteria bacterium]|nr:M14 family metallopeptidase [Alphaproteobacteria bacterium]
MPHRIETITLPAASPGTVRTLAVHRFGPTYSHRHAYFQASMHADELPAAMCAHHLIGLLKAADDAGRINERVTVVPAANPIGLDQWTINRHSGRIEGASNVNFNRGYPDVSNAVLRAVHGRLGGNRARNTEIVRDEIVKAIGALSAPDEGNALKIKLMSLAADAEIALDLHCDDTAEVYLYLGETLWPEAEDLSAELGAVATLLAKDSGGGSFDEIFSIPWWKVEDAYPDCPLGFGCISATVELRGRADVSDDLGARDASGLYRFLVRRGFLSDRIPAEPPALIADATHLTACGHLRAPVGGMIAYHVGLGHHVEKGQHCADVIDPMADPAVARTPVLAPTSGRLFTMKTSRLCRPGQSIGKIAGVATLRPDGGYMLED